MTLRPFEVLRRLRGRTDNAVIASLYSHCVGQPLLIEPSRGAQLLSAYMQGAVSEVTDPQPQAAGTIAIMNISGPLVSRPMPGPSGPGPQNYEELGATFEHLVGRGDVDAIILRMNTPGGFADGLLDFTDQVKAARAEKPIHAVVDHMAYSAGYAIASAAQQVWVTRTAGTGSVGVVLYHVDESAADANDGIKITPIFAGDRKIDFSPHFPLSEEALAVAQTEVDEIYKMFVDAVVEYRGLTAEAVRGTQAGLYMGAAGVEVGFADRVGTLQDAISFLAGEENSNQVPEEDATVSDNTTETTPDNEASTEAQRALGAVTLRIRESGLATDLAMTLLHSDIAEDQIEARIDHAKQVAALCQSADQPGKAEFYVRNHVALDDVRAQLTDEKANAQPEMDVTIPVSGHQPAIRQPTAWDKTIQKFGGKTQ